MESAQSWMQCSLLPNNLRLVLCELPTALKQHESADDLQSCDCEQNMRCKRAFEGIRAEKDAVLFFSQSPKRGTRLHMNQILVISPPYSYFLLRR